MEYLMLAVQAPDCIDKHLADRARKARHRARQRKGIRIFKLAANEQLVVGGLIGSGRISERDALEPGKVEAGAEHDARGVG